MPCSPFARYQLVGSSAAVGAAQSLRLALRAGGAHRTRVPYGCVFWPNQVRGRGGGQREPGRKSNPKRSQGSSSHHSVGLLTHHTQAWPHTDTRGMPRPCAHGRATLSSLYFSHGHARTHGYKRESSRQGAVAATRARRVATWRLAAWRPGTWVSAVSAGFRLGGGGGAAGRLRAARWGAAHSRLGASRGSARSSCRHARRGPRGRRGPAAGCRVRVRPRVRVRVRIRVRVRVRVRARVRVRVRARARARARG